MSTYREVAAVVAEARRQARLTGHSPEWILACNLVKALPGTSMGMIRQAPVTSVLASKDRKDPLPDPSTIELERKTEGVGK